MLFRSLEDYTRNILLNNKEKGIVMNGPVFDGPDAQQGKLPDMSAPSHKDPTFRGIKVPKYFWKILVTARSGKLTAAAFIMSQRDLIRKIDGMEEADIFQFSDAQIRVYQVAVSDLTKLTKLDFGKLAQADTHEATAAGPRLIESLDDIRVG